jgi:hypothetical protein
VVTLGDPEDDLPAIGARRFYPGDAAWQETVTALMDRVTAVLIVEGGTEGLAWELGQVRARVPPERVLLLTLPWRSRRAEGTSWPQLAARATELGYTLPDADPGPGTVLRFDADWRAEAVASAPEPPEMVETILGALGAEQRSA